ncbi:Dihydrolipoyl dehydrogenase [Candidatus Fokinia solitaria]|uniref:Dihydrolipoyl dehydrogenase n=1 Tax=Candidatus Fokinia solitaria TaxID=1802984 RepID=A0A2U8BRQ6_9RICK|nr:dihydrolipoyl dehydrogenase [Candidatus Fokinia solitaria]AWD33019.1 Dihydrolipoyl dehydrogenase [Candidatus Fokinia solitaria]
MHTKYDLAILGGGAGGYSASIEAAKLGKKVVCIDAEERIGGTYVNHGCIPSKVFLNVTSHYYRSTHHNIRNGIQYNNVTFSMHDMCHHKNDIVLGISKKIEDSFRKYGVDKITGIGSFIDKNTISVTNGQKVTAENIIIATGSKSREMSNIKMNGSTIISSKEILNIKTAPKKIAVLGGGVIGAEIAITFGRIGTEVIILEHGNHILNNMDDDVVSIAQTQFKTIKNIKIFSNASITGISKQQKISDVTNDNFLIIDYVSSDNHAQLTDVDILLVAVGRTPNVDTLELQNAQVQLDERGAIAVNGNMQTNVKNVYAIGDVVCGIMLAHKAAAEGRFVVSKIYDDKDYKISYGAIPSVVYTQPEIASVGLSEKELKKQEINYKVAKAYFKDNHRAILSSSNEGFIKILAGEDSKILGAAIVGQNAGELIGEIVLAMQNGISIDNMSLLIHSYPCMNEIIEEVMRTFQSTQLNYPAI